MAVIDTLATVSFGDELVVCPGDAFKEDKYYFNKKSAWTDDSVTREARRFDQKCTDHWTHFCTRCQKTS